MEAGSSALGDVRGIPNDFSPLPIRLERDGERDALEPLRSTAKTIRKRDSYFRRSIALADIIAVSASVAATLLITGGTATMAALAIPLVFVALGKAIGLYDRDQHLLHRTTLDEIPALFGLATLSILLIWLSDGLVIVDSLDRAQVLFAWVLLFVLLISLRATARTIARLISPLERCLFVGDADSALELRDKLALSHSVNAELVGWIPVTGRRKEDAPDEQDLFVDQVAAIVEEREVERVVIGPGASEQTLDEIRHLGKGTKVSVLPEIRRVVSSSLELDRINGLTLVGMRPFAITASSQSIKRAFDLAASTILILLCAPLAVLVAAAIKLDSRGPVLFRQRRAGRHGETFSMLKFRSMVDGAEELKDALRHLNEADGVFKIAEDPRITRVGRFIRRTHLDEIPQLLNVLGGQMSLVGPRPLPLDEDRLIEGWHRRRLDISPGITGPWQILGSAKIPVREMVKLDYQYASNWSLWNDVRILILTIGHVVSRRGT